MKLRTIVLGLVLTVLLATSFAQAQDTAPRTEYPVTIENCGRTLTIESSPQRVLASWQNTGEILLALGLEDRLVGVY